MTCDLYAKEINVCLTYYPISGTILAADEVPTEARMKTTLRMNQYSPSQLKARILYSAMSKRIIVHI